MQATERPTCKSREILRSRLRADLKVYAEAVAVLHKSVGANFERAHQRVERARIAYEAARERLNRHQLSHGCA